MPTIMELRARGIVPYPRNIPHSTAQSLSSFAKFRDTAEDKAPSQTAPAPPKRFEVPERYMRLELARPLIALDDDPVFDVYAAGRILGVTAECLKKWRQRNQGPDYIQYGKNGSVRYELSALIAFRATHRVNVGPRP
jgi:hypothetical protein